MPACHAGGHEFESRTHRNNLKLIDCFDGLFNYKKVERMKKKTFLMLFMACLGLAGQAQRTTKLTVYPSFKPAIIQLVDGRTITQPLANVFLKNGSLLYMNLNNVMEANMKNVASVKFDDREYVKIDSLLTYVVDSVGSNKLYKATVIDVDAYNRLLRNNVNITNLDFTMSGDHLAYTTLDTTSEDDFLMPLINHFYYELDGKIVRVHERDIWRKLPKEKRRIYKTIVGKDDFSWTKVESLMELLKYISEK